MSLVGRLEDLALADIFQILSVSKKTGTLVIGSSKGKAFVVFKDGLVIMAEADILDTNIAQDLRNAGIFTEATRSMVEDVKKKLPEKPLSEICLELGAVKKEHLDRIARKRIEKVVYNLLLWEEGEFQFELDDLDVVSKVEIPDTGWQIAKGMSPEYLLMEGARVYDETSHQSFMPDGDFLDGAEESDEGWESTPAPERKDISALKALTQELRFPNSTSEITLLILRFASDIFERGVLFMVGHDEMAGLGQFGLDIERADEKIRETVMDMDKSPFFKSIIDAMQHYKGSMSKDKGTEFLTNLFGGKWPKEVAIFPVVAEQRVVALLYSDNLASGAPFPETEGLEIFIDQAGLALEKAILQRRFTDKD